MKLLHAAAVVSITFALIIAVWRPSDTGGTLAGLEGWTLDARFSARGVQTPRDDIAILAIDDATLSALKAFPPPRDAFAEALTHAQSAGATVVAFDLLLSGERDGDRELSAALDGEVPSVLAVSLSGATDGQRHEHLNDAVSRSALSLVIGAPPSEPPALLGPAPIFAQVASIAHVNVSREAGGALRRVPVALSAGNGFILPALPLEAARQHAGFQRSDLKIFWERALEFGSKTFALDRQNEVGVNFYGPRGTIQTYSLINAGAATLEGKMVFIGASAEGFGDTFTTPFDRKLPGVEILATLAANFLDGTVLRRDGVTWGFDIIFALAIALGGVLAASREKPVNALLQTAVVWGAALAVLQGAFLQSIWLDGATPLLALLVATACGGGSRWMMHRQRAGNLAQYSSPLLANILGDTARPAFDGRVQKAAALFVDAADFTARSARLGPLGTAEFLKQFHERVEFAAAQNAGIVEQYAGDGAMICFGLPEPTPDDARNALRCAEQLFTDISALSDREERASQQPVFIRIGAHYGDVAASVLGGKKHGHVTLVGDVVNSASRLQEVAKELGAELVVSTALIDAAGDNIPQGLLHQGSRLLRGNTTPLDVWARLREPQSK